MKTRLKVVRVFERDCQQILCAYILAVEKNMNKNFILISPHRIDQ